MEPDKELAQKTIIIDVTYLTTLPKNHQPTGIRRVVFKYIEHYKNTARALIRTNKKHSLILSPAESRKLFSILLERPPHFKFKIKKLLLKKRLLHAWERPPKNTLLVVVDPCGVLHENYPRLVQKYDMKTLFMIHDLIAVAYPEYFVPKENEKGEIRTNKILDTAAAIVCNSEATKEELIAFANTRNKPLPTVIASLLGAGIISNSLPKARPIMRPYFVILGTIEPRKNHLLLLQVWKHLIQLLREETPYLVIIGQVGWECENIMDLLERSKILRDFIIHNPAGDDEVLTYLHHSQALLLPTFSEGFGLPLVDALAIGTPVIASDLPVFQEIAGQVPDYISPLDGRRWLETIIDYSKQNSELRAAQLKRIASLNLPTWRNHFASVDALIETL